MFGILTDNPDASFSLDDFALFAHRFYRTSNLHLKALLSKKTIFEYTTRIASWQALFYINKVRQKRTFDIGFL